MMELGDEKYCQIASVELSSEVMIVSDSGNKFTTIAAAFSLSVHWSMHFQLLFTDSQATVHVDGGIKKRNLVQ